MAKHFNGAYSVRAGYHGSRKKNIANASSVGDNFVFCVECNRYYPKSANHAHDVMQYASNSGESDLETARANAMYYKRQAESQAARIAELEQALREILEGAQGNAGACINCDSIAQRAAAALK